MAARLSVFFGKKIEGSGDMKASPRQVNVHF